VAACGLAVSSWRARGSPRRGSTIGRFLLGHADGCRVSAGGGAASARWQIAATASRNRRRAPRLDLGARQSGGSRQEDSKDAGGGGSSSFVRRGFFAGFRTVELLHSCARNKKKGADFYSQNRPEPNEDEAYSGSEVRDEPRNALAHATPQEGMGRVSGEKAGPVCGASKLTGRSAASTGGHDSPPSGPPVVATASLDR